MILLTSFGCFFFGIGIFIRVLPQLKKEEMIDSGSIVPVKNAIAGKAQVVGRVHDIELLRAPLTGTPCCWWRYELNHWVYAGRESYWECAKVINSDQPFLLRDETSEINVDPAGADVSLKGWGAIPLAGLTWPSAKEELTRWGYASWFSEPAKYCVTETLIQNETKLFVSGTVVVQKVGSEYCRFLKTTAETPLIIDQSKESYSGSRASSFYYGLLSSG